MSDAFEQDFDDDGLQAIFDAVNRYYQEVTVTAVDGECPYGHKVGDKFKLTGMNHDTICGSLYQALHAPIMTLEYGGEMPWENKPGVYHAACPEGRKVQVEMRRVEQDKPVLVKTRTDFTNMTGKGYPALDKYRIFVEILGIENICMRGHKEGDKFEIDPFNLGECCGSLYKVAFPFINLLLTHGQLPWEGTNDIIHATCPDPYDLVTFRLIREAR
jgi:uncharacterized repeat protein (TIGR04076 family)